MPITLTERGLLARSSRGLIANFHASDAIAQRGARRAVRTNAERVVRLAKVYCPVDTGWMREHLKYELSPSGLVSQQGWWVDDFIPFGKPFYPPFQEFGTSRHPAQPSLYPAWAVAEPQFIADMTLVTRLAAQRARRAA